MSMSSRRFQPRRGAWATLAALLLLTIFFGASIPTQAQSANDTFGDYGDAPDATNSTPWSMNAYPWNAHMEFLGFIRPPSIPAKYPTVVDPAATTPQGPWHRSPSARAWLGNRVDSEDAADHTLDNSESNITPAQNISDLEYGDGWADWDNNDDSIGDTDTIILPHCAETSFSFIANATVNVGTTTNYLNVWFDFNRDGDFGDINILCRDINGNLVSVPERAVANMPITVGPGPNTYTTTSFRSSHPDYNQLIWMRMTLTAAQISSADGSGPANGYRYGETEDFLLTNHDSSAANLSALSGGSDEKYQLMPNVSYFTGGY
jgi:hypothetical protein